jgi:hypothetical protein
VAAAASSDRERLELRLDQYDLVERDVRGDGACQVRAWGVVRWGAAAHGSCRLGALFFMAFFIHGTAGAKPTTPGHQWYMLHVLHVPCTLSPFTSWMPVSAPSGAALLHLQ